MTEEREIYISVDIETDGPCPGLNSMLSIGAVEVHPIHGLGREYYATLDVDWDASPDPDTMAWWAKQPTETWMEARIGSRPPMIVMTEFVEWLSKCDGAPIFVGYPAGFDFTFIYYYMHVFNRGGLKPFVRNALDMETFYMAKYDTSYLGAKPSKFEPRGRTGHHNALADAKAQGIAFYRMLSQQP